MLNRPSVGHLRARFRTVACLVVVGVVGSVAASTAIQNMALFTPDMTAAPVTLGSTAIAAGIVQCDREPELHDFYQRAVRSSWFASWLPRFVVLAVGLVLLLPAGHGTGGRFGTAFVVRNVLLFSGWALAVAEVHSRAAGTAFVALWAGTLVVSSSAPAWAAAAWRLPLQPVGAPLGWAFVGVGWLLAMIARIWR